MTSFTYKQLFEMAREKKIKYFKRCNENELEKMLGLEISRPNETFEKFCRKNINNASGYSDK